VAVASVLFEKPLAAAIAFTVADADKVNDPVYISLGVTVGVLPSVV
jgi:hypothetical protein